MAKKITILILLIVLVAGVFYYKKTFNHWPWQPGVLKNGQEAGAGSGNGSSIKPAEKEPREIVMEDVASRIGELSPEVPVLGGQWYVTRFWFTDGSYNTFYVEYEDGHIMRRLLLVADTSQAPGKISYETKAFFEPGESDWNLKSGKDEQFGQPLELYSFDEDTNSWVKKTK